MMSNFDDKHTRTMLFNLEKAKRQKIEEIVKSVYASLEEKEYNPVNQLVGYILSGDPSYITSYKDARNTIKEIERDEILEELIRSFMEK